MEFDKTKVYTALNADELKVGSKCIFSNTIKSLQQRIQEENTADDVDTFTGLYDDGSEIQFSNGLLVYTYAYLIETPEEKEYEPFDNMDETIKAVKKHDGWIKHKTNGTTLFVFGYSDSYVYTGEGKLSMNNLFALYVFADNDSPCGKLTEKK